MSGIKHIINVINNDEKLRNSSAFRDRIYTDQPIIRTASQLKRPDVPDRIAEMKRLSFTPEAYWKTSAWLFRTQGLFMADYTDNMPYEGDFSSYYPTYRDLSTEQLRGYFTWRTGVRKGDCSDAPKAFVLLYLYEIINLIGFDSAEDAFHKLRAVSEHFSARDADIARLSAKWLNDMVVYYDLPPELLSDLPDFEFDRAVIRLTDCEEQENDELFSAVLRLSAYCIEKSAFYVQEPELFSEAACRVYKRLNEYYRTHRKNTLCDKLFGRLVEIKYRMFESAVFFNTEPDRCCTVSISEIQTYHCRNGEWYCKRLHGNRGRNKPLGELMRTVDSLLREKTGIAHKINCGESSRNTIKLAEKEIEKLLAERKKTGSVKIEIDLSALDNIRSAAELTRERLITEDDLYDEAAEAPAAEAAPEAPEMPEPGQELLGKAEYAFIAALLYGGDYKKAAADNGCLPSVTADSINEKLFDVFSDTVIEFDGDKPVLIEDYIDGLKELFPE